MPTKPRVVLDTNVFVSGLLSATGAPAHILDAWRARRFVLLYSAPLFSEIAEVLRRPRLRTRFGLTDRLTTELLRLVERYGVLVSLQTVVEADLDPADLLVLATALDGGATHIVTGDRAVLKVGECQGIPIVTPRIFVGVIGQAGE